MTRELDVRFDQELRVVGLANLKRGVEMDSELGHTAFVVTWDDGFALLAGNLFLNVPHEDGFDCCWGYAVNVGKGPTGWNEVRKFSSVDAAMDFLDSKSMLAR